MEHNPPSVRRDLSTVVHCLLIGMSLDVRDALQKKGRQQSLRAEELQTKQSRTYLRLDIVGIVGHHLLRHRLRLRRVVADEDAGAVAATDARAEAGPCGELDGGLEADGRGRVLPLRRPVKVAGVGGRLAREVAVDVAEFGGGGGRESGEGEGESCGEGGEMHFR